MSSPDDPVATTTPDVDEALAALDRLEAASRRRERALEELADEVPAAVSRTALLRSMVGGLRDLVPSRTRS